VQQSDLAGDELLLHVSPNHRVDDTHKTNYYGSEARAVGAHYIGEVLLHALQQCCECASESLLCRLRHTC
jgi:hypothetical protein